MRSISLQGGDDVHFARRQGDEGVRFEVHEVEGDLRDLADGSVAHEVRVRGRVEDVGLVIHGTWGGEIVPLKGLPWFSMTRRIRDV